MGNLLGLSALRAVKKIRTRNAERLKVLNEVLDLPRADTVQRMAAIKAERMRLLESFGGTSLNLKTFLPLMVKYQLWSEFPSYYSYGYMHEDMLSRGGLRKLDADNREAMRQYIRNIHTMERLTRINTNLALLQRHQDKRLAAGKPTLDVELLGVRIGDFVLTTFPGELTVRIGLNIKRKSPHDLTFVAGYTNGYIYYAPQRNSCKTSAEPRKTATACWRLTGKRSTRTKCRRYWVGYKAPAQWAGAAWRRTYLCRHSHLNTFADTAVHTAKFNTSAPTSGQWSHQPAPAQIPCSSDTA